MWRFVAGVVVGAIVAVVVVMLVESIGHVLFPPPAGIQAMDPADLAGIMARIPVGALVMVLLAWATGALAGGFVAAKIATLRRPLAALLVGGFLLAGGVWTMVTIPHPVWMMVLGVLLPLPAAWLGARLAGALRKP